MKIIDILKGGSDQNLPEIIRITKGMTLRRVQMKYDINHLPNENKPEEWPVKMIFQDGNEKVGIRVLSYSAGYGGQGPRDFTDLLKHYGISYNEDDIYTKKLAGPDGIIKLSYIVNP